MIRGKRRFNRRGRRRIYVEEERVKGMRGKGGKKSRNAEKGQGMRSRKEEKEWWRGEER